MSVFKKICFVCAVVVAVAGLLLGIAAPASVLAAGGPTVSLPTNVHAAGPLAWHACEGALPGRDCADLVVPADYAHPGGPTITVPVARQQATDPNHRIGTIFINTGGPGNPMATIVAFTNLSNRLDPSVLARFDVVGVNPRGTTNGVTCNTSADLTAYWTANRIPQTDTQRAALLAQEQAFNASCVNNNQPAIAHIDSASSIRDMEVLRQALAAGGDATANKITFVGYSYGTFMMQRYAALYPSHVRALLLDSIENHKAADAQTITESHLAFDRSWIIFKQWCQNTSACELHGQNLDQVFDQAMSRARTANGIPAPFGLISQDPVNDWVLTLAIEATTAAGQENFAWTANMLATAVNGPTGDASLARYLYDALTGRNFDGTYDPTAAGTHRAIACVDRTFSQWLNTTSQVKAFETATKLAAPKYGAASLYQGAAQCYKYAVAPVEAAPLNSPVPASVPALLVSASDDASTPLIWAKRALSEMPGGSLLIRDGDGHISYRFSACVRSYATAYLLTLARPTSGTHCANDPMQVIPAPVLGFTQGIAAPASPQTLREKFSLPGR